MIHFLCLLLFTSEQIQQAYDVFMAAFLEQNRLTKEELTRYFTEKMVPRFQKGHLIYTAMVGEEIVGFAIFEKWEEGSYYLAEMAVHPKYQKQGIGKKLIFSILEKTKKIVLMTERDNKWAQGFYEHIGFKRAPFKHPSYPDFIGYEYSQD